LLTDLDMKKPLAVGVRGCRAGSPTRLHKEGNALHRLQSSARVMNSDLGFGQPRHCGLEPPSAVPCDEQTPLGGDPARGEDGAVSSSPARVPAATIEVSAADFPGEWKQPLELGGHSVVVTLQQRN
jgi:hypothetical protein